MRTGRAKLWKTSDPEPTAWHLEETDSDISTVGQIGIRSSRQVNNTNTDPVTLFDIFQSGDFSTATRTITCNAKTKNFDMAISHQFKRLWWWGVDITTDNTVIGIATPITISFKVTWNNLATKTWNDLATSTWDQPLAVPSSVETVVPTSTGTSRRFIKFLKSLRYRQINFETELTTDGSTVDGPARLFTMTIITESKETVPKSVN